MDTLDLLGVKTNVDWALITFKYQFIE